ncbi:MAG: large repetitive protein, partial [Solirubrobacterales bacterium]|nr:large repetitive protein [Solirubrobacterales bacterium]
MTDRIRSARVAHSLRQAAARSGKTARRVATGGLVFAFLLSIVGPAAVMANEGPTGANDIYSVAKNVRLTATTDDGVLANDYGVYADLVASPDHGFLDLHTNGSFTYDPDAGYVGTDVFTYRACDAPDYCDSLISTVTITISNTAPVAVSDTATVLEDSYGTTIDVMANDTDANEDAFIFSAVHQPLHGLVTTAGTGSSATFLYTPQANYFGQDSFTYSIKDSGLTSALGTVTITVTGINDAPSFTGGGDVMVAEDSGAYDAAWATGISVGPSEEQSRSFAVTNDNNDLFETQPAISSSGVLVFQPYANASGSAIVYATIKDGGGTANGGVATGNTATFTITVSAVNDPPACGNDTVQVSEDGTTGGDLNTQCSDVDGSLTYVVGTSTENGTLDLHDDGTWTYTPGPNFNGSDSFSFAASDGDLTDAGTLTLTVNPVNDPPTFSLGEDIVVNEDAGSQTFGSFLYNKATGPANESGQTLSIVVTNDNPELFSTQPTIGLGTPGFFTFLGEIPMFYPGIASGTLSFTPGPNAHGTATVTVVLSDNGGGETNSTTKTFTITIDGTNDAPV